MSLTGNIYRKQYLEGEGFPRGNDGISPTVEVSEDENGHRVEITDVYGTKSFVVKNGDNGDPGEDYVLTEADKKEIAEMAAEMVDVPESGGNVDLTGYATEQFVYDGFQPKGNYLTAVPDGYAKTEDIPTKPEEIGADPEGTAASAVAQHNTATGSHNDIRLELKAINDRLTAFFDSDNQTLDELSEIVAYITSNKTLIDSITTSKVSVADIINNLTTSVSNKPLSAAQGVALKGLIDSLSSSLGDYQPKGDYAQRSEIPTVPANVSAFANDAGYQTAAEVESIVEEAISDIPTGGGGGATDPVEAWKDLASATIAKADAVKGTFVDTGLTFGDLKQYKEIIFRIGTPNSGPSLPSMRVLIKTNQAVDWYSYPCLFGVVASVKSANIAKISFANSQKDIWSCVIGVGSSYDAFQNDLGANNPFLTGNAAAPYELYGMQTYHKKSSAMTDSDHIQFYFNADAPADIRYKITGVFQ